MCWICPKLGRRSSRRRHDPWCVGLESGVASGWPGAGCIEEIYLGGQPSLAPMTVTISNLVHSLD